jgi:nucleoside-diphosphate-sugar epimerase
MAKRGILLRVLVTGVAGFIGSHLAKHYSAEGVDVVGFDTSTALTSSRVASFAPETTLYDADIRDYESVRKIGGRFDCIIHLAALAVPRECEENPSLAFEANVFGTYTMLRYAVEIKAARFIFPSSAHVYGISPMYVPTNESHPLNLRNTYATTKILGEILCKQFHEYHGLSCISLRLYNVFGPRQSSAYFVPSMIIKARQGSIALKGASTTKDFVYVSDVVDAIAKSATSDYIGEVNIGTGIQTRLDTVGRYVAEALGARFTLAGDSDETPTFMQCDRSRAMDVLGWQPSVGLEEGLTMTMESFDSDDVAPA